MSKTQKIFHSLLIAGGICALSACVQQPQVTYYTGYPEQLESPPKPPPNLVPKKSTDIATNSNAIAYDQKLLALIDKGEALWAPVNYKHGQYVAYTAGMVAQSHLTKATELSYSVEAVAKEDKSFILPILNRASLYFSVGADKKSFDLLRSAKGVMDTTEQSGGEIGSEQGKTFKGESYEKGLASFYMGLLLYSHGDYQNARAMFLYATQIDRTSLASPEQQDKWIKQYQANTGLSHDQARELYSHFGDDNRLAHFMLGKTLSKLGDKDNAALAFKKANEYKSAPLHLAQKATQEYTPQELIKQYDIPPQKTSFNDKTLAGDNFTILIGLGTAPRKVIGGHEGQIDYIMPATHSSERVAEVYIDGKLLGRAHPLYNMFHQASTSPRTVKDNAQDAKAALKTTTTLLAAIIGAGDLVKDVWSVLADTRSWGTAPSEIHALSAKVSPGLHTVTVLFYDIQGRPLPHLEQTKYYIPFKNGQETFLTTRAIRNKYNTVPSFYSSMISNIDPQQGSFTYKSQDLTTTPGDPHSTLKIGTKVSVVKIDFNDPTKTKEFIQKGNLYYPDHSYLEDLMQTEFYNIPQGMEVEKVAEATIEQSGPYSLCRIDKGLLDPNETYFVTSTSLPDTKIYELSNHSFVKR